MCTAARRSAALGGIFIHQHDGRHDVLLVRLHNAAVHDHLIEHEMHRLQVFHDVQLAHILEVPVQRLDKGVNELQNRQLVRRQALNGRVVFQIYVSRVQVRMCPARYWAG